MISVQLQNFDAPAGGPGNPPYSRFRKEPRPIPRAKKRHRKTACKFLLVNNIS